ncbi:DUF2637 domain-containing protein [Nocardia puris]|uniref:DUF2637 domain-containing protein n=1 Tax=Nocardia puris TaxID=208602 RepID=UPI001894B36E|nr:DUF2637 domain-containing protein [Nocardia puris]MBF6368918.1 DUF2637 domain-containing protein [Nocardia puris]
MGAADQTVSAGMRWARWSAVVIILGVGVAAFRLSFSTLEDLARLAHIPAGDAWLFPVIVDGTILLATAGVLVCPDRAERRFFVSVLVVGALVSVAGNSLHAVAAGRDLPGWAAALVAGIAPISLLADTHGLALLFRAAQRHSVPDLAPEPVPVVVAEPVSAPVATVSASRSRSRGGKRSGGSTADRVARAVVLAAAGRSVAEIAAELGVSQGTVRKYLKPAKPSVVEPVSHSESESVPAPVSVARVNPVRSSRPAPAQPMLPIAVPVGGN